MVEALTFSIVAFGSAEYRQMVAVRDSVLRKPFGWQFTEEELARDEGDINIAGFDESGNVCATVILHVLTPSRVRLRQVAVSPDLHRRKVGARLLSHAEGLAREMGYIEAILYAREDAIPFYERIGYVLGEGHFEDRGVRYKLMAKPL